MKKIGLNQKFTENIISKCSSLKIMNPLSPKNKIKKNHNSIINKFEFSDSENFENKTNYKNENKSDLKKANNKIINIISNCMEKIQDEKSARSITPHLAGVIEKNQYLKEQRKKNKKQVTFNDYNKSQKSKNSLNKYKSNINQQYITNKNPFSENINNNINKHFHRIRTTSHILKEKESEIVYNISSSLMSLYKPKQNLNIFYDKNKLQNLQQKRNSYCFMFQSKKKNNSKRNSKEYKYQTSLTNDSQIIKKKVKPKKFPTFIKPNSNNSKVKTKKFKHHKNSIANKSIDESLFHNNIDLFNFNKSSTKKRGHYNNKNNNSILNWANDLKNKENLTEGEYVHIQQDIKESLIHFNKKELEEEINNIENTETTNLVKRLPTMKKNNSNESSGKNMLINLKFNNKKLNSKNNSLFDKEKFRLLQHTGYVYDSLDDEEIEDEIDINQYYINPNSIYIFIFDSIIIIISYFSLFYLPYYLAHDVFIIKEYINVKMILFYIIDIFYILDLIISFFRAYYNYDEILIKNIFDMSSHYFSNWFLIDFLAAIPFNSIIFFYERKDINKPLNNNNSFFPYFGVKIDKIYYLLIINKLLKIFKCFSDNNRAFTKIIHILYKNDKIEEKSGLLLIIFILLSVCNFGTCIFIFIGRNSYPSWLNTIKFEEKSFYSIYICSLYYLITTLTTVGYGDIYGRTIQEIVFQIILLMIGTCTYSYLISSVSNFIQKINEKSLIFEKKLKILKEIKLTNPHMKENLYDKLLRFLRYKKNTEKNQQTTIINSLPYSLRNSLIIEMYKPIINNFTIFKGLENTNCIVQLVTAFKPIYAIKNDILIQEGDFIEEVIFVKTGVITLEIEIDLNKPKESIIQYLNRNNQKDKATILYHNRNSFNTLGTYSSMNTSSFLLNHKTTVKSEKKDIKNTHYLKVLDIRKNEHFGETLMFLNERSFLTVKVKSKKAELFFLKKEEVIKIFNIFPNIWNRINKRSIYNMKQIKKIVNKVLLNFCSMIGININDICINECQKKERKKKKKKKLDNNNNKINEMKKKLVFQNNQMKKKKKLDNNLTKVSEFSLSIIKSESSLTEEKKQNNIKKEEIQNKLNINYKDILKNQNKNNIVFNFDKSSNELLSFNSKDNSIRLDINPINQKSTQISHNISNINSHKFKNIYSNSNGFNEFQYQNNINNNISGIKDSKEEKNINITSSNLSKNIEPKKDSNKNNYENNENSSKETVKIPLNKKVCSIIDSDSLEEKNIYDYVNDEIYNNEKFNLNCDYEDNDLLNNSNILNSYLKSKIRIEDLSKKILEKTWVKNLDKEKINYLEKILNKSEDKIKKDLNIDSHDESIFNSSSSISWLLNITNNESFEIKAIYENINDITNSKYSKNISLRNKTKEFLLKECAYGKDNKKSESKISSDYNFNFFKKKDFEKINKTDIFIKKNSEHSEKKKKNNIRASMPNYRSDNYIKKFKNSDKKLHIFKNNSNNLLPYFRKIKKNRLGKTIYKQDKANKSFRLTDEKEMSFYDKYNLTNLSNLNLSEDRPSLKKKKKNDSELDVIKHIIKQDAQNLNQPSLYYQKLFLNQIQKRKDHNQTFLSNQNNKNINNLSLNSKLKRFSTSRELNNINNKLSISLKRNNQKSCLNISTKFKKL